MYPVNALCGKSTTGALAPRLFLSFPRCSIVVNLNFTILVLSSFALVIPKHSAPFTLSLPIIEHYNGWAKA